MHVADVTMFYAPHGGGVRRYLEAKRAWLRAREGCSHTLVVPKSANAPREGGIVGLRSMPIPLSHGYRVAFRNTPAARALFELRPTLIEAGDPYNLAWASLEAGQRLGVPVVGFCHSDLPRVLGQRYGSRAERLASRYYGRLYKHFDLVLAPSRTMTARLRGWGIKHAHHQALGVDLQLFNPQRREPSLRQRLGLPAQSRLLIYAGRFAAEKNLDVLARAMRLLGPGHIALLVGAGRRPSKMPDNMRVLPYMTERVDLATLLASCDAFVHPGDQETFGLAALEAMACGLPVVGAQAAGLAELVSPEVGVLVPPRNARALADGIIGLYERDPASIGVRARRLAERYAWDPLFERILERYRALAPRARS
jgi:alpha-1,6-mannosyltransferase